MWFSTSKPVQAYLWGERIWIWSDMRARRYLSFGEASLSNFHLSDPRYYSRRHHYVYHTDIPRIEEFHSDDPLSNKVPAHSSNSVSHAILFSTRLVDWLVDGQKSSLRKTRWVVLVATSVATRANRGIGSSRRIFSALDSITGPITSHIPLFLLNTMTRGEKFLIKWKVRNEHTRPTAGHHTLKQSLVGDVGPSII